MKTILLIAICYCLNACNESAEPPPDAQEIILRSVAAHGGEIYRACTIGFDFRGKQYTITRNESKFRYTRQFSDSTGAYSDELDNSGFRRLRGEDIVAIAAVDSSRLANSLNSVVYFAALPFPLTDPAVQAKLLNVISVRNEPYYEVEVTFAAEGGGRDHEDRFVYWIHRDRFTLDYLAYRFHVNGGGTRFREAFNTRTINGIRLADYHNYRASSDSLDITDMDSELERGSLTHVSDILLENIAITTM